MRKILSIAAFLFFYFWLIGTGNDQLFVEKGKEWMELCQKMLDRVDWEMPMKVESPNKKRDRLWN